MTNQDKELEEILNSYAQEAVLTVTDGTAQNTYYEILNEDDNTLYEFQKQAKEKLLAWRDKSVNEAMDKHHKAKLVSGKRVGKYEILDRVNDNLVGHTKKLRVMCLECGELMYRTNNRLKTIHRYCPKNLPHLNKKGNSND